MIFSSKEKQQSRYETLINPYRDFFSLKLPLEKQYWTLCANCSDKGILIKESEFAQLLDSGLIAPSQYHGVDSDLAAIESNKKLKIGNFHHGDFYQVMANYQNFNPGIVNLDLLRTFQTELPIIKKVFLLICPFREVLFNVNVLWESHHVKERNPDEILETLQKDLDFAHAFRQYGWNPLVQFYPYKGIGPKTKMISVTMIKK